MTLTVAITGASGFIGSALAGHLRARGDTVVEFVRRAPVGPQERQWSTSVELGSDALDGVDAVVHLAGAGVGDRRWSPDYKRQILASRVDGTTRMADAIADSGRQIRLVSGSAVGYYGDRGDEVLTETSRPGAGFLSEVVQAWELATSRASEAGSPVAHARTGLVMGPGGGAFARILALTRLGLGGPLGRGRQYWPWVTLHDEVRALTWLVDHPEVTGPVNVVGPDPLPQAEVAKAIAAALGRPAIVPAPSFALRIAVGEFASDILASQRVMPEVLRSSGFVHDHATIESASEYLVAP